MSEWKEYSLEEITEPIKETYIPTGNDSVSYIGLEHIEQESLRLNGIGKSTDVTSNKFKFNQDDVLFGKLRPYFRKVVKPKFYGICSTDIWVLRAKENINQNFLFYFIANWDFVNLSNGGEGGTRMPRADWNFLKQTRWIIPSPKEQTAIASILSSLDDKIDLLHRQNATLEKMAETLFRQWFVEEAKEDWVVAKMQSLISIGSGKGFKKESFIENGLYPILGANGEIGRTNEFIFDEKLIYTGRVGTLGNIFRIENEKVWLSDNTLFIKPLWFLNFIYFTLKNSRLEDYNVGSTQPLIRQSDIKEIEVVLPSIEILKEF